LYYLNFHHPFNVLYDPYSNLLVLVVSDTPPALHH
jgi:hypothetical protein